MNEDLRYTIALMSIKGVGSIRARLLIESFGSAQAVFEAKSRELERVPYVGQNLLAERNRPELFEQADKEIEFIANHHIKALIYGQPDYPKRLLECPDAPTLLFSLGDADLDAPHIVGIVGTRNCTQYGRDMVNRFVEEMQSSLPNTLIVSGMALGIDICAHKAALTHQLPTVGIMAHGLDTIYPSVHRNTAREMIQKGGGLLTEYPTSTRPERTNFLARNRIIAGLSDAIVVAESRDKGGSLVTASIALDYNRDVFAFPGRVNDDRSKGCNRLIRLNRAGLITCAQDLIEAMGWQKFSTSSNAIQQSIPFEEENLSSNSRLILDALRTHGDLHLNQLIETTHLDHSTLIEELLDLEIDDRIHLAPGGIYRIR